jgi:transposase-like protein
MTSLEIKLGFYKKANNNQKGGHMAKLVNKGKRVNKKVETAIQEIQQDSGKMNRLAAIQALIPIALEAVREALQREISELAGEPYSRGGEIKRWGENPGSVFLGDQKVKIQVPRARNTVTNEEVALSSYAQLGNAQQLDDMALSRVIHGMSQRNYEKAAIHVPETFGIKKTSTCRRFIRASGKKLKEFMERDLSEHDIVAIFMDGKHFAGNEIVIALGVNTKGKKVLLGMVETSTENYLVCKNFLLGMKVRGLNLDKEILFILDGGKGLNKSVKEVMKDKTLIQRCQWHKRENVVAYLDKKHQNSFRGKLQAAYNLSSYDKAKERLNNIGKELKLINKSALASLEEGLEETLTLHRLGMFGKLGESFKTTNCIENVNKQLATHTDRVDRWHNSDQRQRWVATTLLLIEPRLNKVRGHQHMMELREAMINHFETRSVIARMKKAA